MVFSGFNKEGLTFLQQIKENNTKEWFETHRGDYDALILEPCRGFVQEMGEHLQALVPTINAVPKINGSLFRIYRDIRFSKNKLPIKSRIGVIFWQGGGKRMQSSSFYLHFDPDTIFLAAGIRGFSPESLKLYRNYIKVEKHRISLIKILEVLEKKGYQRPEPKYKRLPSGFDKEMMYCELSLYASMYVYKEVRHPKAFFTTDLCDWAYDIYEDMLPLQQWVYEMTFTSVE